MKDYVLYLLTSFPWKQLTKKELNCPKVKPSEPFSELWKACVVTDEIVKNHEIGRPVHVPHDVIELFMARLCATDLDLVQGDGHRAVHWPKLVLLSRTTPSPISTIWSLTQFSTSFSTDICSYCIYVLTPRWKFPPLWLGLNFTSI